MGNPIPTLNVDWLNAILNHPSVRPWVAGGRRERIDFGPVISAPGTKLYGTAGAAFMYRHRALGAYEVSVAALPLERGPGLVDAFKANIAEFFETTPDARAIYAQVPESNSHALQLARAAGFKPIGVHGSFAVRNKTSPLHHFALKRPT